MTDRPLRTIFSRWPIYQKRFRDVVAGLTVEQLAIVPAPGRWPLWASIGHMACQRVYGLCDVAGEPGADTTPFVNAAFDCPGDDDLEHVWTAAALAAALDSTFAIVERCLDTWTAETIEGIVDHDDAAPGWTWTRGEVIGRSFAHDVSHMTEVNDILGRAGFAQVDLWE
jgi:hypothetical protein